MREVGGAWRARTASQTSRDPLTKQADAFPEKERWSDKPLRNPVPDLSCKFKGGGLRTFSVLEQLVS